MGLVDLDVSGILSGGSKLVDSIGNLFNADEKAKEKIAQLVHATQDKTIQMTMNAADNATKRLESDNLSTEKSTKTIRPKLAIHAAVMSTLLSFIMLGFAFITKPTVNQVTIVQSLLAFWGSIFISIIGFYFVPKHKETLEKVKNLFNIGDKLEVKSTAGGIGDECIKCGSKDMAANSFFCNKCKGE